MFGNSEDDEKWRNLLVFGFYGTNEEYGKVAPIVLIATIIIVVLILIFA